MQTVFAPTLISERSAGRTILLVSSKILLTNDQMNLEYMSPPSPKITIKHWHLRLLQLDKYKKASSAWEIP